MYAVYKMIEWKLFERKCRFVSHMKRMKKEIYNTQEKTAKYGTDHANACQNRNLSQNSEYVYALIHFFRFFCDILSCFKLFRVC